MRWWVLAGWFLAACSRAESSSSAPAASSSPAPALPSVSAPAAATPAASSAPPAVSVTPLPTVVARCCRLDRTEGFFGPEKGIHTRYSGDVLLRNDGERLLFPNDLVSDTKELYQFAKSSGKSLYQERRLRIVGESPHHVSVEVEERGETGANAPFYHTHCVTVDPRKKQKVTLSDLLPEEAPRLLEEGKKRFEASPGQERFRFLSGSFALSGTTLRFCCPARDDRQPTPRLDIELQTSGTRKLVLH